MSETPWLTIIGLTEAGPEGLTQAQSDALDKAEVVMGASRHLGLLPDLSAQTIAWPVPFADGVPQLLALKPRQVVMLVSGDPFWFGAGSVLGREVAASEWRALPAPSTFSLAAAALGWPLEEVRCHGLHATPFETLRRDLAPGVRLIVLVRDGAAVGELANRLTQWGFGDSALHVLEALGGPRERHRTTTAGNYHLDNVAHPVCVAIDVTGNGKVLSCVPGRSDDLFDHDGQITKAPVRAMTLAALAPFPGGLLWDIGAGSGSIAIEWCLSAPGTQAIGIEADATRANRARANATRLGASGVTVIDATAPSGLDTLPTPDAVFVGGGLDEDLLQRLWRLLPSDVRLVANAVTLETEALLTDWAARYWGTLTRIELSRAQPIGSKRGWRAAYPITQWQVTR